MTDYGPKITQITGNEIPVTAVDMARAIWLAKKYSSLTYIRRMTALFSNFVAGYEDYARQSPGSASLHRERLTYFFKYQAALTDGIERIERRDSAGYVQVYYGCYFGDRLLGRPVEGGYEFEEIGWRPYPLPHEDLFAWGAIAAGMGDSVFMTLKAGWAFPLVTAPPSSALSFPRSLPPAPKPTGISVQAGQDVPVSGIWMPSVPSGAPNYLWQGNEVAKAMRAVTRLDYPEVLGAKDPQTAITNYVYEAEPTRWDLLWEDDRYKDGKVPDEEAAYLDPSTEPPPWPPLVPPVDPAHPKPPWRPVFRG
jgi:hypothetical protein